jgi:hypothetical protein
LKLKRCGLESRSNALRLVRLFGRLLESFNILQALWQRLKGRMDQMTLPVEFRQLRYDVVVAEELPP